MASSARTMLDLLDQFVVQIEKEEALEDRYIVLVIDPQLQKYYAHGPLPAVLAMKTLECLQELLTWRNAYQKGNRDSLQALEQEFVHKLKGNGNGK